MAKKRASPKQPKPSIGKGLAPSKRLEFMDGARLSIPEPLEPESFTEVTDLKKRLYLQALVIDPNLTRAARAAGVSAVTAWKWRKEQLDDVVFQAAFERAYKASIEAAESELWRRGIAGYKKPVYHMGKLTGTVQEYDTTAAIFMLKGAHPEKYRENIRQEVTGAGGGPIQSESRVLLTTLTVEEIERRMQEALGVLKAAAPAPQALTPAPAENDALAAAYAVELANRAKGGNGNGQ